MGTNLNIRRHSHTPWHQYVKRWAMVLTAIGIWVTGAVMSYRLSEKLIFPDSNQLGPITGFLAGELGCLVLMIMFGLSALADLVVGCWPSWETHHVQWFLLKINPWWMIKKIWEITNHDPNDDHG